MSDILKYRTLDYSGLALKRDLTDDEMDEWEQSIEARQNTFDKLEIQEQLIVFFYQFYYDTITAKIYQLERNKKLSTEYIENVKQIFKIWTQKAIQYLEREKPIASNFYEKYPTAGDFYSSIEWKEKRIAILQRDDYRCHLCKRKPATTVHHLNSGYYNPELALEDSNLITLCGICHAKWNKDQEVELK